MRVRNDGDGKFNGHRPLKTVIPAQAGIQATTDGNTTSVAGPRRPQGQRFEHLDYSKTQAAWIFIAAAAIGLAQSGTRGKSCGLRMRPRAMCSSSTGLGALPAAGSASRLLS